MEEIKREIEIGKDYFEVWISAQVNYYDADHWGDEWEIFDIKWNELVYSVYGNELIKHYIEHNMENIEKEFIERYLRKCQQLEP